MICPKDVLLADACSDLCNFLGSLIQENLRIPDALLELIQNFNGEILAETFEKMEPKYGHIVLLTLLEELIQQNLHVRMSTTTIHDYSLPQKSKSLTKDGGDLKNPTKYICKIIEIEKMIEESGAAEGGGAVPIFGKAPRPELFARHAAREANFVDELFITQINFLHQLIRKADFDLAFELEFELITKSPGKIKPERATRLFETIDSFITHTDTQTQSILCSR